MLKMLRAIVNLTNIIVVDKALEYSYNIVKRKYKLLT